MEFYRGDRVVYTDPLYCIGPQQNDVGTIIQVGSRDAVKVQFDRHFHAPLGSGIWWCSTSHLRCTDITVLPPPTISLEAVL